MPSASCGLSSLNSCTKASKRSCCCKLFEPGGLLLEGEVHALVTAVLLRMSRLDAFDRNAEAKPPDRELGEIEQAIGTGEGNAVVGADRERQASLTEQSFEGRTGEVFAGRLQGFAQEQET